MFRENEIHGFHNFLWCSTQNKQQKNEMENCVREIKKDFFSFLVWLRVRETIHFSQEKC